MKKHHKKMIAPIIITLLFLLYFAGGMIGVLKSRINERRSGEEDDLSKY